MYLIPFCLYLQLFSDTFWSILKYKNIDLTKDLGLSNFSKLLPSWLIGNISDYSWFQIARTNLTALPLIGPVCGCGIIYGGSMVVGDASLAGVRFSSFSLTLWMVTRGRSSQEHNNKSLAFLHFAHRHHRRREREWVSLSVEHYNWRDRIELAGALLVLLAAAAADFFSCCVVVNWSHKNRRPSVECESVVRRLYLVGASKKSSRKK